MTIKEILQLTKHRPWSLPTGNWKYYQEWNNAVFLHWQVDMKELKKIVPDDLEIDVFDGNPWVSLVAFTMEKIRPRGLPYFPPVSCFDEINIRTYVTYKNKAGVYFLSIEGGTRVSCQIARSLSELPYRYSNMKREENLYHSQNRALKSSLELRYQVGAPMSGKSTLDKWLTEKYALFQDTPTAINEFEIHHVEWPIFEIGLKDVQVNYPKFNNLLSNKPDLAHYSPGVQVIAWGKKRNKKITGI